MRRIDRFDKYMSFRGLNDNIVTNDLRLSIGTIGKSRKEGRDLSDRVIERILNFYTDLNRVWLLAGEGEMINDAFTITSSAQEIIGDINIPAEIVEEIKAEVVEKVKEEESVPIIPAEVANVETVDVRKYIEDNIDELERFHFGKRAKASSGVECVFDNSMAPTFIPSDKVLISFIDDISTIIDGKIHFVQLKNRPTMLRKVKIEGDKLRLIAENPNYGDLVVAHNDIVNIASVVCMVRTSFENQNAEIESLRRKKDSQIDKLIKQNGDALKSINNLIALMDNKL